MYRSHRDHAVFFRATGAPTLRWNDDGGDYHLAGFVVASGQDAHSVIADPKFTSAPTSDFAAPSTYDSCTALLPEPCAPPPGP